jgi:hypothetical protein
MLAGHPVFHPNNHDNVRFRRGMMSLRREQGKGKKKEKEREKERRRKTYQAPSQSTSHQSHTNK